jgi:hypothetical protein
MSIPLAVMPPSLIDHAVIAFAKRFSLTDTAEVLTHQNQGYGPDWCHVSAKAHAMRCGGRRVHGWALWQFHNGLMGDFHSVWEDKDGTLVDVTPPKFGNQVFFIRDRVAEIYLIDDVFAQPTNRMPPPAQPFWWQGKPISDKFWGFKRNAPSFLQYCNSHDFDPNQYPTDQNFG